MSVFTETTRPETVGALTGSGRELSRVQIYKYVAKDRLLDVGDMLS